jgi:uncharacterized membrane protein
MNKQTVQDGKTIAIISYITWIGTLIAFLMNNQQRNPFASFHIRQTIGLGLLFLVNTFVIDRFTDDWITTIITLALIVLWLIGLVGAVQGEEKKVPLFGDLFQEWFRTIA